MIGYVPKGLVRELSKVLDMGIQVKATLMQIIGGYAYEAKAVTSSPRDWMKYLDTAAKLYRYSFPDTLLIHMKVAEVEQLASDAKRFRLIPDPKRGTVECALFKSGQYLNVFLDIDGMKVNRAYSISSSPKNAREGFYELTIKSVGGGLVSNYVIDEALSYIDEIDEEYAAEMQELGRLDGAKIDSGTMALLNSGLQLTNEDWQELANTYKDNYVMTRILQERYNANKPKSEDNGFTLGQKNNGLTFVQFGQLPQDRADNFTRFTQLLYYNAVSDTMPNEGRMAYASKGDYWNYCAKESIGRMKPFGDESFDTVEQDFPVDRAKGGFTPLVFCGGFK